MSGVHWSDGFIAALATCGNVRMAARAVGVDHSTAYARRRTDADFAARWAEAIATVAREGVRPLEVALPHEEHDVQDGRLVRVGAGRIGKRAETAFLEAMGATGSVNRAAEAAGFSTEAFYRRRNADPAFAKAWEAAREMGKGRLADHLLERATRAFDVSALPVADDMPSVSTREAIAILQQGRPSGSGGSGARKMQSYEEALAAQAEVEEARGRIAARLERLAEKVERERVADGWSIVEHEGERVAIPPGYAKV